MLLTLMVITFVVTLLLGMPLAYCMGLTAIVGMFCDPELPNIVLAQRVFKATDNFSLMAIPFFMLAGNIMHQCGITERIMRFANAFVGHLRGGMGHVATVTGVILAGISGSANADAAAIASLLYPTLIEEGYGEGFSASLIASAGVLGPIIPPSIVMIVYASSTGMSISTLFCAGIVPGLIVALGYMLYTYVYARVKNISVRKRATGKELWDSFKYAFFALLMPIIIIGGIISGVFTATEAGAIAVGYGLVYSFVTRSMKFKTLLKCLSDSVYSSAAPMIIICFASMLTYMLTREQLSLVLVSFMTSLTTNYYVMLFLIVLIITILGMLIEVTSAMLMAIPVLVPLIPIMGYDPLHFAMVIVLTFVAGGISPPVGIVLYIVCGIGKTKLSEAVKHIWPFVFIIVAVVVLVIFIPQIVQFLPGVMGLY